MIECSRSAQAVLIESVGFRGVLPWLAGALQALVTGGSSVCRLTVAGQAVQIVDMGGWALVQLEGES